MLTALREADGRKVQAGHCHRVHGPFRCVGCGAPALLVKGAIRVHHFRHQAQPGDCLRGWGESAQHRDCKQAIFDALRSAEGVVEVADLGHEYFALDATRHTLTGADTGRQYRLGKHIAVQLVEADRRAQRLRFRLAK